MVTDEMIEAAAKALQKEWFGGHELTEHGAEVMRAQARNMLLAALAAVPAAEEVERVASQLGYHRDKLGGGYELINPDGPAAASLLRRLSAERDEAIRERNRFRSRIPAKDLTDQQLADELAEAERKFDNRGEHGGSPGEWAWERMDECDHEQKQRKLRAKFEADRARLAARAALQGGEHDR